MKILEDSVGFNNVKPTREHVGEPVDFGLGGIEVAQYLQPLGQEGGNWREECLTAFKRRGGASGNPVKGSEGGRQSFAKGHPLRQNRTLGENSGHARTGRAGGRKRSVAPTTLVDIATRSEASTTLTGEIETQSGNCRCWGERLDKGRSRCLGS